MLESVGSRYLGHYGAAYDNTPELARLAERGITFDRIYAPQPHTSNAMAAIFCSLYPWHSWRSLPCRAPDLRVAGLGNMLAHHGYSTALLHTGDMHFDHEDEFLRQHGFDEVHDCSDLSGLVPAAAAVAQSTAAWHILPDRMLLPA